MDNTMGTMYATVSDNAIRAYRQYGLTGQVIKVRARKGSMHYDLLGEGQVPVKITGEYSNFLCGIVMPHRDPLSGMESQPFPITIHKHDIILQDVIPEYGARRDYGDGLDNAQKIQTLGELKTAVENAVGVVETSRMGKLRRWELASVENTFISFHGEKIMIEVFPSGYIVATYGCRETVFRIEDCGGCTDQYDTAFFLNRRWETRVLLEAENRLNIKRRTKEDNFVEEIKKKHQL